jgi:hypothetical protein
MQQDVCAAHIQRIVAFYREAQNSEGHSLFPYYVSGNDPERTSSRLGWCYGDLVAGYLFYGAGKAIGNPSISAYAMDILTHSTSRLTLQRTEVHDGGICHGSAGLAHIYRRIHRSTGRECFREAADHWLRRTILAADYTGGRIAYKSYDPRSRTYSVNDSLLEGTAGVGLVLLSALTHDDSWDHCLMLND